MAAVSVTGATSIDASNVAWPAEKPKMSTAASGNTGALDVRTFSPSHPSRIHTVPAGICSVTCARARISPRSFHMRIGARSSIPRAVASRGDIQSRGSGSAAAREGSARP